MAKFTWQDGVLVSKAKVEIGGTIYEVDPEEYSGTTPLSANNLNAMQDGIYEDIDMLKPTTLYYNAEGTTGDVILSDNSANYSKIVIQGGSAGSIKRHVSIEIDDPNGKTFILSQIYFATEAIMQIATGEYTIDGSTITKNYSGYANLQANSPVSSCVKNNSYSYIFKVIGYK